MLVLSLLWAEHSDLWRALSGLIDWWPTTLEGCTVLSVHDGDTMGVQCGNQKVKVRLHCIDAPELAQTPWGNEARDRLRELAGKGPVTVQVEDEDKYGRSVAEVWRDQVNLNLTMVNRGLAAVYGQYCDSLTYSLAEHKARADKLGIWRRKGLHQAPWEYRSRS